MVTRAQWRRERREKTGKMFIDLIFKQEYLGMYILAVLVLVLSVDVSNHATL